MISFCANTSNVFTNNNHQKYKPKQTNFSIQKQQNGISISLNENPSTPQFAYQLLEAELKLEILEEVDQTLVSKLFGLYRLAVEYYNHIQNPRQIFFKNKIIQLMNNPVILGALHQSQSSNDTFYKKKQIEKQAELDHKNYLHPTQYINSALQSQMKVQNTLKVQSNKINERLKKRRLSKTNGDGNLFSVSQISDIQQTREKTKTVCTKSSQNKDQNVQNPQIWNSQQV